MKMTNKFTPGPWQVHEKPAGPTGPREYGRHVTAEGGLTICSVTYQRPISVAGKGVEVERIANARLIAAAPELLEALDEISHQCPNVDPAILESARYCGNSDDFAKAQSDADLSTIGDIARAAILKATGGSDDQAR
jgi:hypothetical protein